LSFVVWVLPILGFLGTVIGVSNSMGPLEALAKGESAAKVAPELLRHLRFPFDATFMGLVLLLPMMVCFTVLAARARRSIAELRVSALVTGGAPPRATGS
jgi:biopolymer transport protein ExbB/TolQ